MELLLLFLGLIVVTGLLFWQLTRQTSYRVKNRDKQQPYTSHPRSERIGPKLSDMLD